MFVIFLALAPWGAKVGLSKKDLVIEGIDYKPLAAIVLVGLLVVLNLLRTMALAVGDFVSDRRLLVVTLVTWVVLSSATLVFALLAGTVPDLSPLNPTRLSRLTGLALASQLALALTLISSFVFKPSSNNAAEVRSAAKDARSVLRTLSRRYAQSGSQDETEQDTLDWDSLLGFLDAVSTKGKDLPGKLKCPAESRHISELVAMADDLTAGIKGCLDNGRNAVFDQPSNGAGAAGRDYFLSQ